MLSGRHGVHRDAGQGTALARAEDVQQIAAVFVLPSDPTGGAGPRVLLHGGYQCVVERWMSSKVPVPAAQTTCGAGWKDLAIGDRQFWMSQRPDFVAEAVRVWGGPRLARSHFT